MASADSSSCPPLAEDDIVAPPTLAFLPVPELSVTPSLPIYECSLSGDISPPIENVQCFLTTKDVGDNADQLNALSSLACVWATLLQGFAAPDSIFSWPYWLRYLLEVFDSIQQGLYNAQQLAPEGPGSAFRNASGNETWVGHKIGHIIENLDNFFAFSSDDDRQHIHCLHCVYTACLPFPENQSLLATLNLTIAHDSEAYHTSMLNDMVQKVSDEAEEWVKGTQTNI